MKLDWLWAMVLVTGCYAAGFFAESWAITWICWAAGWLVYRDTMRGDSSEQ